jgi:undecaprenyl-diphosphatase
VSAVLATVIFFALAWNVSGYAQIVILDQKVATWLHQHGTPELTAFMFAVTQLHSVTGTVSMAVIFGGVLARLRAWYWLLTLSLSMAGGLGLNVLLKDTYERVRPHFDDPWVTLSTYSFPSGHTAGATLFYGTLAAFLVTRFPGARDRTACVAGAAFGVVLVAFSRMYLGAHYLSDVLAAACSSLVWLVLCLTSVHALVRRREGLAPRKIPGLSWRWIAPALVVTALVLLAFYLPVGKWAGGLEERLEAMDVGVGMALYVAASTVATLLFVPAGIFELAAGAVFGFGWGIVAALASMLVSAVLAFFMSRYLFRGRVEKWIRGREKFRAFDKAVSQEGWKVVALMRLSPLMSSTLKSYFFGLTRVDLATYASASFVAMLPGVLLKVYIGAAGRDALKGGPLEWSLLVAGILATIALGLVVRRMTRARVR